MEQRLKPSQLLYLTIKVGWPASLRSAGKRGGRRRLGMSSAATLVHLTKEAAARRIPV